jgi:hypothetical protein
MMTPSLMQSRAAMSISSSPNIVVNVKTEANPHEIASSVQQAIDEHHEKVMREANAVCSTPEG